MNIARGIIFHKNEWDYIITEVWRTGGSISKIVCVSLNKDWPDVKVKTEAEFRRQIKEKDYRGYNFNY